MTTRTEIHIQEICRRARQYRQQYERRMLSILSVCSLFLLACITTLLKKVQTQYGYEPVITPHIGNKELYVTSGHYAKYGKDSVPYVAEYVREMKQAVMEA